MVFWIAGLIDRYRQWKTGRKLQLDSDIASSADGWGTTAPRVEVDTTTEVIHEGAEEEWSPLGDVGALQPLTPALREILAEDTAEHKVVLSRIDELGEWFPEDHPPVEALLFRAVALTSLATSALTVPISTDDFVDWTMTRVLGSTPSYA